MVSRSYRIGEIGFAVRATSPAFGEWLDYALAAYRVPEEADPWFSIVVGGRDEQHQGKGVHIFYRGTSAIVRTLHLPTLARALVEEMEALLFDHRDDAIYVEMALVASNGVRGVAPPTVLAYLGQLGRRVDRMGLRLPATRYLAVDPVSGRIEPVRPKLEVPADALDRLAEMMPSDEKPDRLFVDEPLTPDVVCVFWPDDESPLRPMSRAGALQLLGPRVANVSVMRGAALEGLARLVEAVPCYALDNRLPAREMLDLLATALRVGPSPGS